MKLRYVNGFRIRNRIDLDFGILGRFSLTGFAPNYYIPRNEVWIDQRFRRETAFLLAVDRFETMKLTKGIPYETVRRMAIRRFVQAGPLPKFRVSMNRRISPTVVMVNGTLVRQYLDPDFIFGGHAFVYSYIPSGELWLDTLADPREVPYHLLHERTEYALMRKGIPYDSAHDSVTATDKAKRRKDGIGQYPGDAHAR